METATDAWKGEWGAHTCYYSNRGDGVAQLVERQTQDSPGSMTSLNSVRSTRKTCECFHFKNVVPHTHVKDPVVDVRFWWIIMETRKDPTRTL